MRQFALAENRIFQVEGQDFLFLPAENAIFQLDGQTKTFLDRCPPGRMTETDFLAHLDGPLWERKARFTEYGGCRLIAPCGGCNAGSREATVDCRAGVPVKTLVLQLTEACNLECAYCYHEQGRGNGRSRGRPMDHGVGERAVDFLLSHSGELNEVVLVFFGGEPLLNFRLMTSLVPLARRKAEKAGKKIDFAVTTNGTLLSEEVVAFLNEQGIGVTVSIDGDAEAHDRFRRFGDGSGSYEIVSLKVKALLRRESRKPAVARVTLAGGAGGVIERVEHLLNLGFVEVGVSPVTAGNTSYQLDDEAMDVLLGQFRILAERLVEAASKDKLFGFSNLIDLLVALHQGELKTYPCGAGLGLFSVNPRGELYACQRVTGERSFHMGNVFDGLNADRVGSVRAAAHIGRKTECRECWARMLCAGGCYHEAWVRRGDLFLPNSHLCRWIRNWIALGLETYGRIFLSSPAYLDQLAVYRGQMTIFHHFYD